MGDVGIWVCLAVIAVCWVLYIKGRRREERPHAIERRQQQRQAADRTMAILLPLATALLIVWGLVAVLG